MVLAGAGSGKTRVLVHRIENLVSRRVQPERILAVTFTNKAAREMKDRVGQLIHGGVEGMPWLGTFHSIGAKILRRHAELVGLQSNFTILDTDDQLRLLKQLIAAADVDEKRWPARALAGLIDRWKNKGWTPDQVDAGEAEAYAFEDPVSLDVLEHLEALREAGVVALKIEGRQRGKAYVAEAVSTMRKAVAAGPKERRQYAAALARLSEGQQTTSGAYDKRWR